VPFVPVKAQAGYVRAIDQEIYLDTLEKFALPPGVSGHGAIWRYWEVEGDSMEPVFRSGDIILTSLVHPMDYENLRNFYVYVIVTRNVDNPGLSDRVLIKRVYAKNELEWVLISENEDQYGQQLLPVQYIKEVWVYRRTWAARAEPTKMFEIKV
jgi:phage repressor protein C with HTH and peptisase S24 domain